MGASDLISEKRFNDDNGSLEKKCSRTMVTSAIQPHISDTTSSQDNRWRPAMTSAHALPSVMTKVLYFSLVANAFVFISMLLLTGLHP
jgi:hypothetical protein